MSRISKAYQAKFRALLQQARARRLEQGVQWLMERARRLSRSGGLSPADALDQAHEALAAKSPFRNNRVNEADPRFFCDAGLGGLARWLRAAGYETSWQPDIADDELLREARKQAAIILTTDSMLMERRVLRDRVQPALWLPPALGIARQLGLVFREFRLTVREPRCMACGGELRLEAKEALRERIPPRTYRWLDEYFVCARCGQVFWRGTHWQRIQTQLRALHT